MNMTTASVNVIQMELRILTYKETKKELLKLQLKREEILDTIREYETEIADVFQTQSKRVNLNATFDKIILDLSKNRHVVLRYSQLEQIKTMFECDDILIRSPTMCKIELILEYSPETPDTPTSPDTENNENPETQTGE